ncbi:hypothetical protein SESBI_46912 [Sesbania bispinosa]|nr:hypothetical protein SESBI_46912 [Sesbania bispinosa]
MSVTSSSRGRITTELQIPKKWTDRETSPERTKVWTEPKPKTARKVSVVTISPGTASSSTLISWRSLSPHLTDSTSKM